MNFQSTKPLSDWSRCLGLSSCTLVPVSIHTNVVITSVVLLDISIIKLLAMAYDPLKFTGIKLFFCVEQ
jgi:hypothetical protein